MFNECRSVVADVQCYSVDRKGYYSELQEFNFTAPLDLDSPLKKWIADNADPVSVFILCVVHSLYTAILLLILTGLRIW